MKRLIFEKNEIRFIRIEIRRGEILVMLMIIIEIFLLFLGNGNVEVD